MIRLVIDANILVAELLRKRGRDLIKSAELEICLAQQARSEAEYELGRVTRIVAQGRLSDTVGKEQLEAALQLIDIKIRLVPKAFYSRLEVESNTISISICHASIFSFLRLLVSLLSHCHSALYKSCPEIG